MSNKFTGTGGFRSRGAFFPALGLPTVSDIITPEGDQKIRKGDAFVAKATGTISSVVNGTTFAVGDRIVFRGTDPTLAAHWSWAGPVQTIPANPSDSAKKVVTYALSEDDNNS